MTLSLGQRLVEYACNDQHCQTIASVAQLLHVHLRLHLAISAVTLLRMILLCCEG